MAHSLHEISQSMEKCFQVLQSCHVQGAMAKDGLSRLTLAAQAQAEFKLKRERIRARIEYVHSLLVGT